jgi:hypothetical protein
LAELTLILDGAGLPFAPVRTPSDLFEDPQMNVPGRMLPIRLANGRETRLPPLPLAIDGETMGMRIQPASAGQHSSEVMDSLGYDATRQAALRGSGAVA